MAVELKVPTVGESITEVQIGQWLKGEGQAVTKDENLVEIETDKATVEIVAPITGTISKVLKKTGDTATVGEIIGYMEPGDGAAVSTSAPAKSDAGKAGDGKAAAGKQSVSDAAKAQAAGSIQRQNVRPPEPGRTPEPRAVGPAPKAAGEAPAEATSAAPAAGDDQALVISPEVPRQIPRGREIQRAAKTAIAPASRGGREEEVVPMSPIRKRIAQRLVEAQHNAALLTTFNEVDMSAVMALRSEHKGVFEEKYGIKLGFMSFFVKAAIDALKLVPGVNAEIRDTNIVYHNYFDIGIAVGGGKGLVVPVLRDADRMSFADIELTIADLATRARKNALQLEELQGGTFTISNGGVYGSLLSTPIVNPPQSGILGLHTIQERPVARDGQVVIKPMMYLALTYDHRIVDGQGAVTFLKRVKEVMEEPMRMLVEV
jgi:2-oxoglutarate dehydrogenase E2 component (dihydrolipoamide succinyltransferase)